MYRVDHKRGMVIFPNGKQVTLEGYRFRRVDNLFDEQIAYNRLPWYKKLFTKKPKSIFEV